MKLFLILSLAIFSLTASAAWNEVECSGLDGAKAIRVEVEQAWPNGSYWKQASVTVDEAGAQSRRDYTVTTRYLPGFSRVEYSAGGFRLEVDFWPDQRPRWGWTYRGTFQSDALGNMSYRALNCRFPNVQ